MPCFKKGLLLVSISLLAVGPGFCQDPQHKDVNIFSTTAKQPSPLYYGQDSAIQIVNYSDRMAAVVHFADDMACPIDDNYTVPFNNGTNGEKTLKVFLWENPCLGKKHHGIIRISLLNSMEAPNNIHSYENDPNGKYTCEFDVGSDGYQKAIVGITGPINGKYMMQVHGNLFNVHPASTSDDFKDIKNTKDMVCEYVLSKKVWKNPVLEIYNHKNNDQS